ncbi:MAG TPA: glycosyltransferase family 39 protein [Bryobacteraceae bacterium]|jgi:4-amino-4-deoxy-L-arabinose transferase-like glycosyltransferase
MSTVTNRYSAPAAIAEVSHESRAASLLAGWAPYLLALYFALSALRGVSSTDVIDTDAARHAMNGTFIYDMVRSGQFWHPVRFARLYYSHLPALSMPYHPPLFPAIESLFFAAFGVKLLTARVAVAVSVGLCALLLFKLVHATLGSRVLAACVTVTTWSLWTSQLVARDVMLEYPSMAFALAALYCVRDLDHYTMRRALLFAVLAAAAVWTKQHTVFVGAVPLVEGVLTRRWKMFSKSPIWISTAIFSAAVLSLMFLSKQFHGTGIDQMSNSAGDVRRVLTLSLPAYFELMTADLKGLPGIFLAVSVAAFFIWTRKPIRLAKGLTLYFAWMVLVCVIVAFIRGGNSRYLFFVFPAAITVGYTWLIRGCSSLWGEQRAAFVAGGFAVAWFVVGFFVPVEFLRGVGASAKVVAQGAPVRVVYAGEADGNFIFAVRSLDSKLEVTVVPAAKLPPDTFEPKTLDAFCRQFGIDWVILENGNKSFPWSSLRNARPDSLKLERSIPLESNRSRWANGTIDVYRFSGPPGHPGGVLDLPVGKIGGSIGLKL